MSLVAWSLMQKIERQGAMFGLLLNMMRDQLSRMYLSAWSQPSTHIHDRCFIQIQRQSVPTCYPTLCLNGPFHHLATLPLRSVMQRTLSRLNRRPARLFGFRWGKSDAPSAFCWTTPLANFYSVYRAESTAIM